VTNKLLDFQASISDVKQINPLFSTCKVRVLYTGKNRNMSIITKDAVEKALPTLKNIPIVGEYSEENEDYKGHGGAISMDDYRFIHTTKPYGVVPESASYEWEEVKGRDGSIREYLTINGCYLWTGRYEEAFDVVENGKGQSMEIEVTDGRWVEEQEAYQIDNFVFSALCILGNDVEPAFEDANITAYSLDKDSFKQEFSALMSELKSSLSQEEEVKDMEKLKELLEKYSLTMEDITAKGIDLNEISEEDLESKIVEVFEIDVENSKPEADAGKENDNNLDGDDNPDGDDAQEPVGDEGDEDVVKPEDNEEPQVENAVDVEALQARITKLEGEVEAKDVELNSLREFKLNTEKAEKENKAQKLFNDFQLTEEDVKGLDIHKFSLEEIEEKCYAILGRKMASKKNFSKLKDEGNIRITVENKDNQDEQPKPYGGLFEKYKDNN
jgi:hypothetical protein